MNLKLFTTDKTMLDLELAECWISYGYGEKLNAAVLKYSGEIEVPYENLFIIAEEDYEYSIDHINRFFKPDILF